jgi:hypothetical protein
MNRSKEFENQDNNTDHNKKGTKQGRDGSRVVDKLATNADTPLFAPRQIERFN